MSRSVPWRSKPNEVTKVLIRVAGQVQMYLIQESGPTAFVLMDHRSKKYKVRIGDRHYCSCNMAGDDVCIHMLFVLLRVFRVPPGSAMVWQGGLIDREIEELLKGREWMKRRRQYMTKVSKGKGKAVATVATGTVEQRPLTQDDTCPICQEDMLDGATVVYCVASCGNNVHRHCMKVWADHRISLGEEVTCPLCRENWRDTAELRKSEGQLKREKKAQNVHMGVSCHCCGTVPIATARYRCVMCDDYDLCQSCFSTGTHSDHPFEVRLRPNEPWVDATRDAFSEYAAASGLSRHVISTVSTNEAGPSNTTTTAAAAITTTTTTTTTTTEDGVSLIPHEQISDLEARALTASDYDTLMALHEAENRPKVLPRSIADLLPAVPVTSLVLESKLGERSCSICLDGYDPMQLVKGLPCDHFFHAPCIDEWLCHSRASCPIDNDLVLPELAIRPPAPVVSSQSESVDHPVTTASSDVRSTRRRRSSGSTRRRNRSQHPLDSEEVSLGVAGVNTAVRRRQARSRRPMQSFAPVAPPTPSPLSGLMIAGHQVDTEIATTSTTTTTATTTAAAATTAAVGVGDDGVRRHGLGPVVEIDGKGDRRRAARRGARSRHTATADRHRGARSGRRTNNPAHAALAASVGPGYVPSFADMSDLSVGGATAPHKRERRYDRNTVIARPQPTSLATALTAGTADIASVSQPDLGIHAQSTGTSPITEFADSASGNGGRDGGSGSGTLLGGRHRVTAGGAHGRPVRARLATRRSTSHKIGRPVSANDVGRIRDLVVGQEPSPPHIHGSGLREDRQGEYLADQVGVPQPTSPPSDIRTPITTANGASAVDINTLHDSHDHQVGLSLSPDRTISYQHATSPGERREGRHGVVLHGRRQSMQGNTETEVHRGRRRHRGLDRSGSDGSLGLGLVGGIGAGGGQSSHDQVGTRRGPGKLRNPLRDRVAAKNEAAGSRAGQREPWQ